MVVFGCCVDCVLAGGALGSLYLSGLLTCFLDLSAGGHQSLLLFFLRPCVVALLCSLPLSCCAVPLLFFLVIDLLTPFFLVFSIWFLFFQIHLVWFSRVGVQVHSFPCNIVGVGAPAIVFLSTYLCVASLCSNVLVLSGLLLFLLIWLFSFLLDLVTSGPGFACLISTFSVLVLGFLLLVC